MSLLRDASRRNFSTRESRADHQEINTGSLQRIADAVEKMAANYDNLSANRDYWKRRAEENRECSQRLMRRVTALRGVITRMKRQKGDQ